MKLIAHEPFPDQAFVAGHNVKIVSMDELFAERENLIRAEHPIELRGTFKEPNCGESYWRDKAGPGPIVWSDYRKTCIAWRDDYNKKNGTSYTIADTIP